MTSEEFRKVNFARLNEQHAAEIHTSVEGVCGLADKLEKESTNGLVFNATKESVLDCTDCFFMEYWPTFPRRSMLNGLMLFILICKPPYPYW